MNFKVTVKTKDLMEFYKFFHTMWEVIQFAENLVEITQVRVYEHERWIFTMQVTPNGKEWYTV